MADEMDENLSSNDETRVRLPGNEGSYTKQSSKRKYKSKIRTFHGNGYSKSSTPKSPSKVVNNTETVSQEVNQKSITFYQKNLRDIDYLIWLYSRILLNCKQSTSYVDESDSKRKGWASYIIIKCFQCTYTIGKYTSQLLIM